MRGKNGRRRRHYFRNMWKALQMELREHKSSFLVYFVLRALVIVSMVLQILNGNYENAFLCVLTLLLLMLPGFFQVTFKVELPTTLEIIILLFVFAAEILGEISEFYIVFPYWDTILHTLNGFLMAAIGFSLVELLSRSKRIVFELSPVFVAIVGFCFSMTIGVIWEFFEYFMDSAAGFDMQKDTVIHEIHSVALDAQGRNLVHTVADIESVVVNGQDLGLGGYLDIGLIDTMNDLLVNFIGALVFCVIGYFYVKKKGEGKVAKQFIPIPKEEDKDFLRTVEEAEFDRDFLEMAQKMEEAQKVRKDRQEG